MLQTLAVQNYRTLRDFVVPLGSLNLITGADRMDRPAWNWVSL